MTTPATLVYRCPDETYPISQAVHLGRLTSFYPRCRQCVHCNETGTLSSTVVKMLNETHRRTRPESLFTAEEVSGAYLNELSPPFVRQLAAAFGLYLRRSGAASEGRVVLAGDGRALAPELAAAASDGLRWSGWDVVDLGAASAPVLAGAAQSLSAAGGLFVGNVRGEANTVSIKLWGPGGRPISAGAGLEEIEELHGQGADRPTRVYGGLTRFQADRTYLAGLEGYYHALRPLRFVIDTGCRPLVGYFRQLSATVACEASLCREPAKTPHAGGLGLIERVRAEQAHFGIWIDGDAEACTLVDERGETVDPERLTMLLAGCLLQKQPGGAVVLEEAASAVTEQRLAAAGACVVRSGASRAAMHESMSHSAALFGGGPSGRFWYRRQAPTTDALETLSLLLTALSQSDRHLSERVAES
jgi:phosphomannomutase